MWMLRGCVVAWLAWLASSALIVGCAAEPEASGGSGGAPFGGSGGASGSGQAGVGGASGFGGTSGFGGASGFGGFSGASGISGGAGAGGDDCAGVTEVAEAQLLPTDVIWAIDTSGSMTASFPAIQQALNAFSQRVVAANIDAHIILLAGAGGGLGALCVPAPLGSGNCGASVTPGGSAADSREPAFLHLDLPFGSTQGMATLLNNHPSYRHLLRANARTQLVITEDGAAPFPAAAVTAHIEGRTSTTNTPAWMPGLTPGAYQWNGIVCTQGVGSGTCFLAFGAIPQTVIDLVAQTQGLIRNLDDAGRAGVPDPFADLLDRLAEQVIVGARVGCEYSIPEPPPGETFDRNLVNVVYRSGANSQTFPRAPMDVPCADNLGWKYDDETTPTRVNLCPAACTLVQGDPNAAIDVRFGCDTELLRPE